jgi:hypothetical protein
MRVPGGLHVPKVARRKVTPSRVATVLRAGRQASDPPASFRGACSAGPSHAPSPSTTTVAPAGLPSRLNATHGDGEGLGPRPLGALAHAPRSRQGAPLRDHVEPQRRTAAPHDPPIHPQPERLSGAMGP